LEDCLEGGLRSIVVSAYSRSAYEKALALRRLTHDFFRKRKSSKIDFKTLFFPRGGADLDERLTIYDRVGAVAPAGNAYAPCSSPLRLLDIDVDGHVVLCCYDWKSRHTFGNIAQAGLDEILRLSAMFDDYVSLMSGVRERDICRACDAARDPAGPEAL
jgi:hypothetical protein